MGSYYFKLTPYMLVIKPSQYALGSVVDGTYRACMLCQVP